MATVGQRKYTPEDLLKIHSRPMPELVDGELWERNMGYDADAIASKIGRLIGYHVDSRDLGQLAGSQGSFQIFPDHPDRVRIPDVSFIKKERFDPLGRPKGHCRISPDLVVEVVSPKESAYRLESKIQDYLAAGVPLIWVVYPEVKLVRVFLQNGVIRELRIDETIDGGEVLPGFECNIARFFE